MYGRRNTPQKFIFSEDEFEYMISTESFDKQVTPPRERCHVICSEVPCSQLILFGQLAFSSRLG
jgi:hypothetical protein